MIQSTTLKGTGVALITPFDSQKNIDFKALKKLIEHTINGGANYLVALGTTAETATLSENEKQEVATFISQQTNKRVPLIIGAGGNNTTNQLEYIQKDYIAPYDALLIATPYYNKPNQEGLYQHYKCIAQASTKPIILYNVPGRTGVNLSTETTIKLANEFNNIIAIKEASGDFSQINHIYNQKPEHFEVISGDDGLTLPLMSIGVVGVISVLANALPKEVSTLTQLALEGKFQDAKELHNTLLPLMEEIFAEGNPTGIKALLEELEIIENNLRLPLVPASEDLRTHLSRLLSKI